MQRHDGSRPLRRLFDYSMFDVAYREICDLARQVQLNVDPPIPAGISNRGADNCRSLVQIADLFGREWSEAARAALVDMSRGVDADDRKLAVLCDTQKVRDKSILLAMGGREIAESRATETHQ